MLNIPEDYTPYKLNCIAGDAVVGILCRRPDGGVSDWHATMNKKAVNGICPISGKPMREVSRGIYSRKTGDILVVMTNAQATRSHTAPKQMKKRTVIPQKKTVTYERPAQAVSLKPAQPEKSIDEMISEAMKEAGL